MVDYNAFKRAAIRGQDEIVSCPFNPSHQISRSRLQYHITKCEKQHSLNELGTCPFNPTHRIPKPEMQMHLLECPDKRIVEMHKFQVEDESHVNKNLPDIHPPLCTSEENWDNVDYQSSYIPSQHINNKCVIRNIQGASKSERKLFRLEERKRLDPLGSENSTPEPSNFANVPRRVPRSLPKGMTNRELGAKLGMGRGFPPFT
ncbi:hypothetical protein R5R35_005340 [Gryllus longicercus]|uniref:CHHC U11-48K-type domain-containing protein n=1 Tax=Gryllus longicercus TaxID=2509291 RepID=A0AAN9VLN7_9ORTH